MFRMPVALLLSGLLGGALSHASTDADESTSKAVAFERDV
jgi:hypothetical protein